MGFAKITESMVWRQPITFTLTTTRASSRELIGDRRATDEVVAAAQPHFLLYNLDNRYRTLSLESQIYPRRQ